MTVIYVNKNSHTKKKKILLIDCDLKNQIIIRNIEPLNQPQNWNKNMIGVERVQMHAPLEVLGKKKKKFKVFKTVR